MSYIQCKKCGSKHFFIDIVVQVNGNDDTYEYICTSCGEYVSDAYGDCNIG
jgi:DNA-directed RNA polymerase subunit RPC12/RpoP